MPDIPHFDVPFRLLGSSFAQNEQGSSEDIFACVQAVVRYHPGERELLPEFGMADMAFSPRPVSGRELVEAVQRWEPRAALDVEERPEWYDLLADRLVVEVSKRETA